MVHVLLNRLQSMRHVQALKKTFSPKDRKYNRKSEIHLLALRHIKCIPR